MKEALLYKLFISHFSALEIFRNFRNCNSFNAIKVHLRDYFIQTKTVLVTNKLYCKDIKNFNNPYYDDCFGKLDVIVDMDKAKRNIKGVKTHCYKYLLPRYSFVKYDKNTFISCPEFLFCQLANELCFEDLFLLGLELCGSFSVNKNASRGFVNNVEPLCDADDIIKFAKTLDKTYPKFPNIKKALQVSKYLKNNAASPQEAILYVKLCAPRFAGGYGIKDLLFNQLVNLSDSAMAIGGQTGIYPDLSNCAKKLAIEYDSDAFHENSQQDARDKMRINALVHDGWKCFSFVKKIMNDEIAFDKLAKDILRANGQTCQIKKKNFDVLRHNLFNKLRNNNVY